MALSKEQRANLRNIHIYEYSDTETRGVAIKSKVKKGDMVESYFVIPNPYQLTEEVFKKILTSGFSNVERVSPPEANCVIRVFQVLHYEYDSYHIFNIYGADCFTKKGKYWISSTEDGNSFTLDPSRCLFSQWLYQDEKITFDADFVDIYVKVS